MTLRMNTVLFSGKAGSAVSQTQTLLLPWHRDNEEKAGPAEQGVAGDAAGVRSLLTLTSVHTDAQVLSRRPQKLEVH